MGSNQSRRQSKWLTSSSWPLCSDLVPRKAWEKTQTVDGNAGNKRENFVQLGIFVPLESSIVLYLLTHFPTQDQTDWMPEGVFATQEQNNLLFSLPRLDWVLFLLPKTSFNIRVRNNYDNNKLMLTLITTPKQRGWSGLRIPIWCYDKMARKLRAQTSNTQRRYKKVKAGCSSLPTI